MNPALLGMGALLLTSACFSGAEAALFTLAAERGKAKDVPVVALRLLQDQVGVLTTILLANLVVNLGFFAATHSFSGAFSTTTAAMIQLTAVMTIVLGGEILPKVLAHRFPRGTGRVLLLPVAALHLLLGPILRPFGRRWGGKTARPQPLDSAQAADLLLEEQDQILDRPEQELVQHLLELGELRAGALRRPLSEVPQVTAMRPLRAELRDLEAADIPWAAVVNAKGEVEGILDRARLPEGLLVRDAMRKVPVLPEVAPVANGVQLLRTSGCPFVLLVDEYGQSVGIIQRGRWADTLLDRLPATDQTGRPPIRPTRDDSWEVDASLPLHDFEDRFGAIGEVDVRVDTVGGLVAEKLGRMAEVGDEVMVQGEGQQVHFTVLACSETRPLVLTVRLEEEENPAGSEELA